MDPEWDAIDLLNSLNHELFPFILVKQVVSLLLIVLILCILVLLANRDDEIENLLSIDHILIGFYQS